MIGIHDYPVFVSAAMLLNMTPGPDTMYIIFLATGTTWCLLIVGLSSGISQYFRQNLRTATVLQRITGTLFIGLGLKLAMTDR